MKNGMRGFAVLVLAAAVVGCGGRDDLIEVTGTVTNNGEPVPGVGLDFEPADGRRSSAGQTDSSGVYRLYHSRSTRGALPGEHDVTLVIPEGAGGASAAGEDEAIGGVRWPTRVTVDHDDPTIDFELGELNQ